MPEGLLQQASRLRGVTRTLAVLKVQASVIGRHGRESVDLIGADPHTRSTVYVGGPLLRRFSAAQLASAHAVALPTPLAQAIGAGPLEAVRIQVGASVVRALLAATLNQSDIGGLVHSPVVLTNVAYAQRLAGLGGRISRIFVRPQRGARRRGSWRARWARPRGARKPRARPTSTRRCSRSPLPPRDWAETAVFGDQRDRRLHVRAERDARDGARAAQADRRTFDCRALRG